jgi:CheY-like chemotaxis protein
MSYLPSSPRRVPAFPTTSPSLSALNRLASRKDLGPYPVASEPPLAPLSRRSFSNTVMIVDDDHVISRIVRKALEKDGFQTQEASSGNHCLSLLDPINPPALIFIDIMLQDIDGSDLYEKIKKMFPRHDIPVVFLTGLVTPHEAHHLNENVKEKYRFVGKPVSTDQLRELAQKMLNLGITQPTKPKSSGNNPSSSTQTPLT